ncbi:MAG: hypothetical protein ACLFP8_08680 [Alphaproteobacteria bacterium]
MSDYGQDPEFITHRDGLLVTADFGGEIVIIDFGDMGSVVSALEKVGGRMLDASGDALQVPVSQFLEAIQAEDVTPPALVYAANGLAVDPDVREDMLCDTQDGADVFALQQYLRGIAALVAEEHGVQPLAEGVIDNLVQSFPECVLEPMAQFFGSFLPGGGEPSP